MGGKIGVLVEVNCETDFVARNEAFQAIVKDVAMHIAAAAPQWVRREEVPAEIVAKELEIAKAQMREQKKPEAIIEKIAQGKVDKFFKETCLLEQPFVKDDKKSVQEMINDQVAKIGENIQVRRFARFVLGEGLEKKTEDYAAEVAKAAGLCSSASTRIPASPGPRPRERTGAFHLCPWSGVTGVVGWFAAADAE